MRVTYRADRSNRADRRGSQRGQEPINSGDLVASGYESGFHARGKFEGLMTSST